MKLLSESRLMVHVSIPDNALRSDLEHRMMAREILAFRNSSKKSALYNNLCRALHWGHS